jgi:PHD/YefM family antitoxin component YafN of YafNO toxin-antitoxin module
MKFFTVSELRLRATEIVRQIASTREDVIVTKNGKPVVVMKFITEEAFRLKDRGSDDKDRGKGSERG